MSRRIIITGGGTGIGLGIAHRFLDEDPDLVLIGRRQEKLDSASCELLAANPTATVSTHSCDLADPAAVQALADRLLDQAPIDVLVLNAGGNHEPGGPGLAGTAADWRGNFEANVLTSVLITEALLDHVTRPGGRIVMMSSISGMRGSGSYGAAKAAVNAWMWALSTRVAAEQITVNAVAPGFVPETDFWIPRLQSDPSLRDDRVSGIPMRRPGTVREVAEAVAHFASPDAGWTTGQILQVNGGAALGR